MNENSRVYLHDEAPGAAAIQRRFLALAGLYVFVLPPLSGLLLWPLFAPAWQALALPEWCDFFPAILNGGVWLLFLPAILSVVAVPRVAERAPPPLADELAAVAQATLLRFDPEENEFVRVHARPDYGMLYLSATGLRYSGEAVFLRCPYAAAERLHASFAVGTMIAGAARLFFAADGTLYEIRFTSLGRHTLIGQCLAQTALFAELAMRIDYWKHLAQPDLTGDPENCGE